LRWTRNCLRRTGLSSDSFITVNLADEARRAGSYHAREIEAMLKRVVICHAMIVNIQDVFPDQKPINRTTLNTWEQAGRPSEVAGQEHEPQLEM
jgi:hypothetical protein